MSLWDEIQSAYRSASLKFSGQPLEFPFGFIPENNGKPHIEIHEDGKIALVGTDMGHETKRQETYSVDELMYWIFKSYAISKAFYGKGKKHHYDESRKIALDEIEKISSIWRSRLEKEWNL
jgi:hypothetical protein